MEKKFRKELEKQISITLAYFLKKQDEKTAAGMEKPIRSASRELARKFVKERADLKKKADAAVKKLEKKKVAAKPVAKKKVATPAKKKVARKTAKK